ncbi:MAG: DUF4268 domain-containing protein [Kiritimatiellae bacterium]|nr:DUF4268 domain-containing protein [Kiritimatiellia bacterium]
MKTLKLSLRKIVSYLNNPDEDGGFWLPNIQRPFVWSEDQICRLFDSILRQYPISTLLIWKTKMGVRRRKFIDNFKEENRNHLSNFKVPDDENKKCLVLDGQQRLQSLYIALRGSYDGKELYLDILSGELAAPDDVRYKFKFLDPQAAIFPHIRFKDIVFCDDPRREIEERIAAQSTTVLSRTQMDRIRDHVDLILTTFLREDGVGYQELDSIEQPKLYREDDVVEIFIRANSGGTRLGKSDLLFSLLTSAWDEADDKMEILLDELNMQGFAFTRDFILKTCLTLLGQGARYEVEKFRKAGVRGDIEGKWDNIIAATKDVADFVQGSTFIRCDKALPSYLVLIPLVYLRYHFPAAWNTKKDVELYLLRSLLAGAFGGTPDQLIDDIVNKMKEINRFDLNEMFGVIRSAGRSLELTEDRFWAIGYGSENIHLLFNLWYRDFNYTPAFASNLPQIDHVFPQSALKQVKVSNPNTGKLNIMKYREGDRNQLANCMLLTAAENGAGGKSDTPPDEWFKDKDAAYLARHLIPPDPALWKLDRYEDFIAARKKLIKDKFAYLLTVPAKKEVAVDSGNSTPPNQVAPNAVTIAGKRDAEVIKEDPKRFEIRKHFWTGLLEEAKQHTRLFYDVTPGNFGWIGAGAGKTGLTFCFAIREHYAQVEIYIDRRKNSDKENKNIFCQLYADKDAIEKAFGDSLEWQKLEDKRACRIRKVISIGGYRDEAKWPAIYTAASETMARFEKALKPFVAKLQI